MHLSAVPVFVFRESLSLVLDHYRSDSRPLQLMLALPTQLDLETSGVVLCDARRMDNFFSYCSQFRESVRASLKRIVVRSKGISQKTYWTWKLIYITYVDSHLIWIPSAQLEL